MKKLICTVLVFTAVLGALSGCKSDNTKYSDYSFDYFDTVTTIVGYENSKEEFDGKCREIKSELEKYHKLYDIYNSYDGINNLYSVNSLADGKHTEVELDRKIIGLLEYSVKMYSLTDKKLNIAMGSVLKIWHDYRNEGKAVPNIEILSNANSHTAIENIIINKERNTVYLADDKMFLDVGAVAKGYAVEQVAQWMREKGYYGYILNVGGNVCTVGERKDGKNWEIAVEDPQNTENYTELLKIGGDKSLVTSGSYQRFYTVDGKDYHHIIDTKTLMPADYFLSVTVLCENSALADALSTALFCMSYEDGIEILKNFDGAEAMWIDTNGTKYYTKGFKNYIKN